MRIKKIEIPIYYGYLVIIVADDFKEVTKKYKIKENVDSFGAFVCTNTNDRGHEQFLVCMAQNIPNELIAHEVVHLVNAIFARCNIELDRHNDEPQAYLTGWLFNEIEKFLNKK